MFDNPKWFMTFFIIAVGLTVFCAIGDGIIAGPDSGVMHDINHGDIFCKMTAMAKIFTIDYSWMASWLAWVVRIINTIFLVLLAWQIASMVRGR